MPMLPSPTRRRIRYRPITVRFSAMPDEVSDAPVSSGTSGKDLLSASGCPSAVESTPSSIMQRAHEPAKEPDGVNGPPHRSHRFESADIVFILSAAQCCQKKADLFVGLFRCGYSRCDLHTQQLAILLSHPVYLHAEGACGQSHLLGDHIVTIGFGPTVQKHKQSVELLGFSLRGKFRAQSYCGML